MHDLKGDRNAQRVLKQMSEFLNVTRGEQNIYYLNAKGREMVGCSKERRKNFNVNHYLMRNELYINLGCPKDWRNEIRVISRSENGDIKIVADAIFNRGEKFYIVEVDHLQKMKNNKAKIDKYRRLIERNAFNGMPKLIWVTVSEYRRKELATLCDGLDVSVYLMNDFY